MVPGKLDGADRVSVSPSWMPLLLTACTCSSLQRHLLELGELFCSHTHTHPDVQGHFCPLGRLSMIMTGPHAGV